MSSNFNVKTSRSRRILDMVISNTNNNEESDRLGYEIEENLPEELSLSLPHGASDILEKTDLSLLNEIFNDGPQDQDNIILCDKSNAQDTIYTEFEPDYLSNQPLRVGSPNILPSENPVTIESIQDQELNSIYSEKTPMPSPGENTTDFGDEEPVPSVSSWINDVNDSASSPFSQYSSDNSDRFRLRTRKRKYTKKKGSGKLREKHSHEWIDTKRKILKNSGESYKSRYGKIRDKKYLGGPCEETCKLKCFDKIDRDTRAKVLHQFWGLGDHSKQYDLLIKNVIKINKKRSVTQDVSRRSFTYIYHLPICVEDRITKLIVCKKMFLNTLGCGPKMIRTALLKSEQINNYEIADNRCRHNKHKTPTDEQMKKSVCDHVHSFEPVSSHYCRKDTSKVYLDGSLSIPRMYNLYKEWFDPSKYTTKCQTVRQYRVIVYKNINLSFHRPKKDQCHVCHSFKNSPITPEVQESYDLHINNKVKSRSLKNSDKHDAQRNSKIFCTTYDLQKVLLAPSGGVSLFYYCKRLKVYNLSVFDIGNLVGTCYLWNEQIAMKGSNEITSCIYNMIEMKTRDGCDDFRFWSDNCTGQNRNRIMFFMYLYAAKKFEVNIKHTFLEKGHTQNEGDSIHATIERAAKYKNIYTPSEWSSLIRWAKVNGTPYNVIEMTQNMIFDFKKIQSSVCYNWVKNSLGDKIQGSKIKQVRADKDKLNILFFKYDLSDEAPEYILNITVSSVKTRRQVEDRSKDNISLSLCYNNLLPIAQSKKRDLLRLCQQNIIPPAYHSYYESLVAK